jgi:hypothetical protein
MEIKFAQNLHKKVKKDRFETNRKFVEQDSNLRPVGAGPLISQPNLSHRSRPLSYLRTIIKLIYFVFIFIVYFLFYSIKLNLNITKNNKYVSRISFSLFIRQ